MSYADQWRVPDALWEIAAPLLPPPPPHPLGCCKKRKDDRCVLNAIFFVLRTGCQWNALNATGLCSSSVAHRRFQEWVQAGVFLSLWAECLRQYEAGQGIAWDWLAMDGVMTKAPLGGALRGRTPRTGARAASSAAC